MSEWSFLSMTRERRTFPSYGKQTSRKSAGVLSAPSYIPLLWWAIFRPEDLVLDRFAQEAAEDGEPIPAPVVERTQAADRLAEAISRVELLYPKGGSLARHAELLAMAIAAAPKKAKFVTLEHIEIAAWFKRGQFAKMQQGILSHMAGDKVAGIASLLRPVTKVVAKGKFILPDEVTKEQFSKANQQDLYGILGGGADGPAPWDKLKPRLPALNSPGKIQAALSEACWTNDLEQARAMLALGASPHKLNKYKCSPLEYAVTKSSPAVVELLLEAGGRPLAKVVCEAAYDGNVEALALLLAAGGDADSYAKIYGRGEQYAVSLAAVSIKRDDKLKRLKLLLEHGADVNLRNADGDTCLAEAHRETEALRLMLPHSTKATRQNTIVRLNATLEKYEGTKLHKFIRRLQDNLRMVEEFSSAPTAGTAKRRKRAKS